MSISQEASPPNPFNLGFSSLNSYLSPGIRPFPLRALPGTYHLRSPNEEKYSLEILPDVPLRLTRSNYHRKPIPGEADNLFRQKKRLREQQQVERESCEPSSSVEPESSSSQPSEPCSGSRKNPSPFIGHFEQSSKRGRTRFTEEFYQGILDFLDNEGLDLIDPLEQIRGFKQPTWLRVPVIEMEAEEEGYCQNIKQIKSATHSPKLINDQIITSTLFQRRASRSQGPGQSQGMCIEKPLGLSRPANLKVFKHFKDDVNNLMQVYSPIEEGNTPSLSRHGSEALEAEDTPEKAGRLGSKRSSFRFLKSPMKESETPKYDNSGLLKYTTKPYQNIRSPHPEIQRFGSFTNFGSPTRNPRDSKMIHSLRSSPNIEDTLVSPKKRRNNGETPGLKHGVVIRKSQFRRQLSNVQEISPVNF